MAFNSNPFIYNREATVTEYDYDLFVIGAGSGGVRILQFVIVVTSCLADLMSIYVIFWLMK